MAFVVDTAQMQPGNAQAYLRLVETEAVPVMTDAGAGFVSCWETSGELGEEVSVKTIWSFTDHVEWNVIRKNMVLDPRYYEYSRKIAQLRTGGTRRFFYPASFSPRREDVNRSHDGPEDARHDSVAPRVLRRFEIYTMAEGTPPEKVRELEEAFRRCGEFIPELTHSVVGNNLSDVDVQMVWEHGYASPEAYQRYMVHPFHANVLDRYLLHDSPERIVGTSPLGDGALVGYTCDGPTYLLHDGMRKVVLFGLEGSEDRKNSFIADLRMLAGSHDGVILSVMEPNTFGVAWFDGVTPMLPPSQWTHVWELGFESAEAYDAYQKGASPLARAERDGWSGIDVVRQAVEMHYDVKL